MELTTKAVFSLSPSPLSIRESSSPSAMADSMRDLARSLSSRQSDLILCAWEMVKSSLIACVAWSSAAAQSLPFCEANASVIRPPILLS